MVLKVRKMEAGAKLPCYGHRGDAGLDLFSVRDDVLESDQVKPIATGIQVAIPMGYVGLVWDKSSISLSGVHRLAGVIDSGYRGEIKVVMINLGREPFVITKGMKIAQMLIQPVLDLEVVEEEELESTRRGTGGFGSTGKY